METIFILQLYINRPYKEFIDQVFIKGQVIATLEMSNRICQLLDNCIINV